MIYCGLNIKCHTQSDAKGSDRRLMAPVPSRESDHEGSMEAHNIGLAI